MEWSTARIIFCSENKGKTAVFEGMQRHQYPAHPHAIGIVIVGSNCDGLTKWLYIITGNNCVTEDHFPFIILYFETDNKGILLFFDLPLSSDS